MTTRTRALVGSFVFFWVAPAVVAGVGPFALVGWTMQPPLLGLPGERVVGVAVVAAGLACLLDCFARFALEGRGTPAPVAQTEVLVAFHLNVLFYEEPTLRRRFGGSYETYYLHVGRWWTRLTPWRGSGTSAS